MELISRNIYICLVCSGTSRQRLCKANCTFFPITFLIKSFFVFFLKNHDYIQNCVRSSVYYLVLSTGDHSVMGLFSPTAANSDKQ